MKERIRTDGLLLAVIIILMIALSASPLFYALRNRFADILFDFFGFILILKGIFLRMSARGHKKAMSAKSNRLVTTGPYTFVRNPMYLGTFIVGVGFALMIWPWWFLSIFTVIFYLRFRRQIKKEEKFLNAHFDKEYQAYCQKVPQIIPSFHQLTQVKIKEIFNLQECFSTSERRAIIVWPLVAIGLEFWEETAKSKHFMDGIGFSDFYFVYLVAALAFLICFAIEYQRK